MLFRTYLVVATLLMTLNLYAETPVTWNSDTHKQYFLDVNNDGTEDLLLQSRVKNQSHLLIFGKQTNHSTQFHMASSQTLKKRLNGQIWLADKAILITGYFNNDEFEDALIIKTKQNTALLLKGKPRGFRKPVTLTSAQFDLPQGGKFEFYTGDFNGDGQNDLLALATDNGSHHIYHSRKGNGFTLAQVIHNNKKWGLKKNERLYIDDFNQDGKDDIFALAKKAKQSHFLIFANEKGKFRNKNAQQLQAEFANTDWYENSYSSVVINTEKGLELVRLYNQNGGIDHEGYYVSDESDPLRFKTCKHISFHPQNQQVSSRCRVTHHKKHSKRSKRKQRKAKLSTPQKTSATGQALGKSIAQPNIPSAVNTTLPTSVQKAPQAATNVANEIQNRLVPATPQDAPTSPVGAYPAVQQTFTVSWKAVPTATHYEIWVRHRKDEPENTYITTSETAYDITETFPGGRFYYIKACNQYGCSGFSPYKSVFIYDKPSKVTEFKPDISVVQPGDSINLLWRRPEGMIGTGGYYEITQIYTSDIQPQTSTETRFKIQKGHQVNHSLVLNSVGQYRFKINACNKTHDYCSDNSNVEAFAATVAAPPSTHAYIRNLTYSPVKLSVGHEQHSRFDYINSTFCSSSNSLKNGQPITGVVTYLNNPEMSTGKHTWSTQRTEAVTWEFDVSCRNDHSSFTQHVSTIIHAATPPTLAPDQETARAGEQKTIRVLANDTDTDQHPLRIVAFTQPSVGSVNCGTNTTLATDVCVYTAPEQLSSHTSTSFTYTVSDGWTTPVTSTATINVLSNETDAEVVVGQWESPVTGTYVAPGYAPVEVSVGDTQSFGFSYSNARYCENSNGNPYVRDNGQLQSGTYTWITTRDRVVEWDFTVTCYNNNSQATFQAKAQITSGPPARTTDDSIVVREHVDNTLSVLANDETPDRLAITKVTQGQFGTVTISDDGKTLNYRANPQFIGKDQFSYTVVRNGDTGNTADGTVYVDVMPYQRAHLMVEYLFDDASNLAKDTSGLSRHGSVTNVAFKNNGSETYADFSPAQYSRITLPTAVAASPEGTMEFRFYNTNNNTSLSPRIFHATPHNGFAVQLNSSSYMGSGVYNAGWKTAYAGTKLNANQWYRGTVTWGPNGTHAYINGVHGSTTSNHTGSVSQPQRQEFLGYVPSTPQYDFRGYLDYFRVYDVQLSHEQIASGVVADDVGNEAPGNKENVIVGVKAVNQILSSNYDVSGITAERIHYRWYRNNTPIYGADKSRYLLTEVDAGQNLHLTISYRDSTGKLIQIQSKPFGPIQLTIPDKNGLPRANNDQIAFFNQEQAIPLKVLENDLLAATEDNFIASFSQATHGQLIQDAEQLIYIPDVGYTGTDSFTYTLSDGFETSTATVQLEVVSNIMDQKHRNLVLEYLFDDASNLAKDTSGLNRHGSVTNVAFKNNGKETYADFSPAQYSRIALPTAVAASPEGTMEFRFYNTNNNTSLSPRIFHATPHNGFAVQLNSSSYMGSGVSVASGKKTAYADTKLNANQWYRGTVTWGPNGMHAYINGIHGSTTSNYTGSVSQSQRQEFLGYVPSTSKYDFRGYLDYFRVYDKQFSNEEISQGIKGVSVLEGNLTVSGNSYVGGTLSALLDNQTVTIRSVNYRWLRNDEPIYGAASASYLLTSSDIGQAISVHAEYRDTDNNVYVETSSAVQISDQPPIALRNLAITPTTVTMGSEPTLSFDYSNAITCFNTRQPEMIFVQNDAPQTGQFQQAISVGYQTGLHAISVSCTNLLEQISDEVSLQINKLAAPHELTSS